MPLAVHRHVAEFLIWEENGMKKSLIAGALVLGSLSAAGSPAFAASGPIKIVLAEEADLLEPCMATRSNIGRIIMENVS